MAKRHKPRSGSLQFWPRKRAKCSVCRVRKWAEVKEVKPLGFIGYKACMAHVAVDYPKNKPKPKTVNYPITIIECPPNSVIGVCFYKGSNKVGQINAKDLDKNLSRTISVGKKEGQISFEKLPEFDDLNLLVATNPSKMGFGTKKPKIVEIAIGGKKDDKLNYAKEKLGKELLVQDVFDNNTIIDTHGITKGKGFSGTVKIHGVAIRDHKSEKVRRGPGNLGPWTPTKVSFRAPMAGKLGYHLRTEYNKWVIQILDKIEAPKGGIDHYGVIKNTCVLLKGSVLGPRKRAVMLTKPIRYKKSLVQDIKVGKVIL